MKLTETSVIFDVFYILKFLVDNDVQDCYLPGDSFRTWHTKNHQL